MAFNNIKKIFGKILFVFQWKVGFIFDGISNAAEKVGIADHVWELAWKLWDGEGKGSGDTLEDTCLIGEIFEEQCVVSMYL